MLVKISISSKILMVVLNGFLLMCLLNGRKFLLCYKLDVLCQNAYRKCFIYSREAEKGGLTLYSLVMDSGGGCGLLVLYVWCTGGERGASAPTQQLSTSHVQTSSHADALYTGRCRGQSEIASFSLSAGNLRFKILIKTDK